jgi:hypothetical protein
MCLSFSVYSFGFEIEGFRGFGVQRLGGGVQGLGFKVGLRA